MITHLYVKSRDNSSNGIAVIGQKIFVEYWLWRPSCLSENTENQYQPMLMPPYIRIKSLVMNDDILITFPLIDRTSSKF